MKIATNLAACIFLLIVHTVLFFTMNEFRIVDGIETEVLKFSPGELLNDPFTWEPHEESVVATGEEEVLNCLLNKNFLITCFVLFLLDCAVCCNSKEIPEPLERSHDFIDV